MLAEPAIFHRVAGTISMLVGTSRNTSARSLHWEIIAGRRASSLAACQRVECGALTIAIAELAPLRIAWATARTAAASSIWTWSTWWALGQSCFSRFRNHSTEPVTNRRLDGATSNFFSFVATPEIVWLAAAAAVLVLVQAIPFSLKKSLAAGVTKVLCGTVIALVSFARERHESRLSTETFRCSPFDGSLALAETVG